MRLYDYPGRFFLPLILLILALAPISPTLGDNNYQKIIVAISPEDRDFFAVRDMLCFFPLDSDRYLSCGKVFYLRSRVMFVALVKQRKDLARQTTYRIAKLITEDREEEKGKASFLFSPKQGYRIAYIRHGYKYDFSLGLMTGISYSFPALQIQLWLGGHFALGLKPFYFNALAEGAGLRGQGAFATLDYYFSTARYSGFVTTLGLGIYAFTESNNFSKHTVASPAASLNLGYQWRPRASGFNIRLSAGAQYLSKPNLTLVSTDIQGILPLFMLDIGYAF